MARYEPEVVVTQSLLDRLIDDDPSAAGDPPSTHALSFRQFKAGLRRDLEWLLNTRQIAEPAPEAMSELAKSVFNYGLPDISSIVVSSAQDRARLLRMLETTVSRFEPRIAHPLVTLEQMATGTRTLRFRIEGLMRVDPAPEHVSFDTVLELTSGEYEVK